MATITAPEQRTHTRRANLHWHQMRRVLVYVILILGCTATLVPFLWMILSSLKTASEIIRVPPTFLPETPTMASFRTIFTDPRVPISRFYFNSAFVAVANVTIQLFTSSLAGYIFAKYHFSGKNLIFGFILASMMIPFQVTIIPAYLLIVRLGLADTLWGLIVPSAVNAFGIFLMKQFIEGLPSELIDAARIDGAGEFGIYWRVILPQVGPALATLGVLNFMSVWNAYLWPLIVITTHERRTLPIMLTWYNSQHGTRYDLTMAASILVVLPIIIVYILAQRWIVQGIALTGMK
jgi:multiple sugar transport system permease protein